MWEVLLHMCLLLYNPLVMVFVDGLASCYVHWYKRVYVNLVTRH